MKWACAASAAFIFVAAISAFPPGMPVGQSAGHGTGGAHVHAFRDITVPIAQVTTAGNVSLRSGMVDVVQLKKLENGTLVPEKVLSGVRTVGIAPDRKSIILRIPENDIGALNASLNAGGVILMPHR